ncbi:ABC transporter permease subunit [Microbacterium horticulturae]|uniref:ABC transporter permease subunit n=1 Tax=Microbacterium horticulturae TaxID=3028316 RepID=A0ABY8C4Q3_9MICO|nr:ABC transporter permease subunit [Microbacterium sp. KACC 23027]WEG10297.1 ABC transporter permease subunit [Microbacterium sp. KACC 23027]
MTAVTLEAPARVRSGDERLTFGRVLRSETIKLLTLRSTWWSIAVVAVLSVGLATIVAASMSAFNDAASTSAAQLSQLVASAVISPIQFTMLLAGALGAIAVTGEYSTGMIRSTLTAEPRRGVVLSAKAIVVAALLLVVSLIVFVVSTLPAAAIIGTSPIDLADPGIVLQPILYGALSMAVFAVIGLSWGFLLRSGPGAIAATVGLLFVLPIIGMIFPSEGAWSWISHAATYLPMSAAQSLTVPPGADGALTIPVALITLAAWVVAGLLGSWAVLRSRDA